MQCYVSADAVAKRYRPWPPGLGLTACRGSTPPWSRARVDRGIQIKLKCSDRAILAERRSQQKQIMCNAMSRICYDLLYTVTDGKAKSGMPLRSQGLACSWTNLPSLLRLCKCFLMRGLVMDLSDHTDCCGSECKLFHLGACSLNSPRLILVDSGSNVCHAWTFLLS